MRTIVFALLCLVAICAASPSDPEISTDPRWLSFHEQFRTNTANNPGIPIIFYGDSITEWWHQNGRAIFDVYYEPLGVANYGIAGDRTQHLLWRILNGEVVGLNPKLVVLKIGTNNLATADNAAIAEGITAVVSTLRQQLPNTKVLLLGVLPRTGAANFDRIVAINAIVRYLNDGENVFFLDMFDQFRSDVWGVVNPLLFNDGLHLTTAGYQLWAYLMNPLLKQLIQ